MAASPAVLPASACFLPHGEGRGRGSMAAEAAAETVGVRLANRL